MFKLYILVHGKFVVCLKSKSNLNFGYKEKLLFQAYIPGMRIIKTSDKVDFVINHIESDKRKMINKRKHIIIYDKWQGKISMDIYHLIYSIVRIHYLNRKLFPIHAACINSDGLILLVGHSGSGKTNIALQLLDKNKKKIFSGDKTIISFASNGNIKAIAGINVVTGLTKDIKHFNNKNKIYYHGRSAFLLNEDKIASPGRIKAIVLIKINDGKKEFHKINFTKALHTLYPFFLDIVNADTIICEKDIFMGTPPKDIQKYLIQMLNKALNKIPVYSITGSRLYIVNKIKNI
ncbi:MAG TPA: hypothetical protein VJJ23_04245 [Candidatus Nanoarchaeia archaeon]|nr:hypothetical protein [Candidatus Nanoarchaeia archaeon]